MKTIATFNPSDRFLPINIYKFPLGNCGGITDTEKTIYIPHPQGFINFEQIENSGDLRLVFIPEQRGADYWAVKPLLQPEGQVGPMAGGNLAYSSDSRCKVVYHVHDRFETQEVYDRLSR